MKIMFKSNTCTCLFIFQTAVFDGVHVQEVEKCQVVTYSCQKKTKTVQSENCQEDGFNRHCVLTYVGKCMTKTP